MRDAGQRLREMIRPARDMRPWLPVLPRYAEVQIELTQRVPYLLALGVPDRRLPALSTLYEPLLADVDVLRIDQTPGLTRAQYERLLDLTPRVAGLCERLAGYHLYRLGRRLPLAPFLLVAHGAGERGDQPPPRRKLSETPSLTRRIPRAVDALRIPRGPAGSPGSIQPAGQHQRRPDLAPPRVEPGRSLQRSVRRTGTGPAPGIPRYRRAVKRALPTPFSRSRPLAASRRVGV
jgi:hypothetical protein